MKTYDRIAIEIDEAGDAGDAARLRVAIDEINLIISNDAVKDQPLLHYFRANAFSGLRQLDPEFEKNRFAWQQPEFSEEILSLRRATKCSRFNDLHLIRRCQILTNLGNALDRVGRPIEAIAAWDKALRIKPKFAMAAANRAYGLSRYSSALYDPGHQCIFLHYAAEGFRSALDKDAVWDSEYPPAVIEGIQTKLVNIEGYIAQSCQLDNFDPNGFETGRSEAARSLNQWRLESRLFLNPLNDLGAWPVAAQDVFHLPNHRYAIGEAPRFVRYYDWLKQEYVAACVLLHEGLADDAVHPADETLLTFEHADYSVTSVQIEKQKTAFRMAYSLLDKCALFINDYFDLGNEPKSLSTSFRKVWFKDPKKGKLNPKLPLQNWRLRGLYSLSLDLFDDDLKELASPLAIKANDVRNAAEHRFVSVHEFMKPADDLPLSENVTVEELSEMALHTLKLARAAIMGLSLAIHHQETHLKCEPDDRIIASVQGVPTRRR